MFVYMGARGQNNGCLAVCSNQFVDTEPGKSYYTIPGNGAYDVQLSSALACQTVKEKWSFTYTLEGATQSKGSGTLKGEHINRGVTQVIWTCKNSGTTISLKFEITVFDKEKPEISCNNDITVHSQNGVNGAVVTYPEVKAKDNCKIDKLFLYAGLPSGSVFPVGMTPVIYKAIDNSGNVGICSFYVNVTND